MLKNISIIAVLLLLFSVSFSQVTAQFTLNPEMKKPQLDSILYFPVNNEQQLVVIDYETGYNFFMMEFFDKGYVPPYPGKSVNEYFIRDSSGKIIKCYNSTISNLDSFESRLKPFAFVNRNNHHRSNNLDHISGIRNHGHYDVFLDSNQGVIDSFGQLIIPIEYQYIIHKAGCFLAQKNDKWCLINPKQLGIKPTFYDKYMADEPFIYFINKNKFVKAYHLESDRYIDLSSKSLSSFDNKRGLLIIQKNGLSGLYDIMANRLLIPKSYTRIVTYYHHSDWRYLDYKIVKVNKNGKYGLVNLDGKTILSCIYDEIYSPYESGKNKIKVEIGGEVKEMNYP